MAGEKGIDRIVKDKFFKDQNSGVFVDVGAADPEYLSISHRFRQAGWTVIAIEPNPEFCRRYRERGYEVEQCACGNRDEDGVAFFVFDSGGKPYEGGRLSFESFSSLRDYTAIKGMQSNRILTRLRRLDSILEEKSIQAIDVLSVDVEGTERDVIEGLSIDKYKPKVIILENLFNDADYRKFMKWRGYNLWATIDPNDIYIPE